MRSHRLLQVLLLLGVASSSVVEAGPVTGQPLVQGTGTSETSDDNRRRDAERREEEASAAFTAGSLFDGIGLPLLRVSAPIYLRLDFSTSGPAGDPGAAFSDGGGGGGGAAVADLSGVGLQLGSGSSLAGNGGVASSVAAVPEPGTLLLVAPAAAFVARRVIAARRSRK